jgi:transcriptional repressor NrdR
MVEAGLEIVSGGTDTHLMLVDLRPKKLTGKAAETALGRANITCNKNGVPFDPEKPTITSGIRLGSPAGTTRGFGVDEFREVGDMIRETLDGLLANGDQANQAVEAKVRKRVDRAIPHLWSGVVDPAETAEAVMRCPYCGSDNTQVKDSRPSADNTAIRRRRVCPVCGGRFTTFERIQLRELTVLKRSGRRVPFDRDKLMRSVQVALRKRQVDPERVERMVSGIVRQLESAGDAEIPSDQIGLLVMEGLKRIDDVAYVRFASVYRNFREAKDFETLLGELSSDGSAPLLTPSKVDDEPV